MRWLKIEKAQKGSQELKLHTLSVCESIKMYTITAPVWLHIRVYVLLIRVYVLHIRVYVLHIRVYVQVFSCLQCVNSFF